MSKQTTISVSPETLATWNELSARTRIPISTLLKDISETIQKQLDLMESGKKLLFMADFYNKDNVPKTIVRLSDAFTAGIPSELNRDEVLKAFGYEMKDGHLIDTTEKKEEVAKA